MIKSKKDKIKYTGFPGDCSEQQLICLEQFKNIVKTLNKGVWMQRWDDAYLLRFLRARKFNMKQTQKMWTNYRKWREDNQIDKLQFYYFPQLAQIRKLYPHGYHKHDKNYRPIYIQRLGFTNADQIFKITTPQKLLNYNALSYQTLITKIFQHCTQQKKRQTGDGTRVMQTCTILDLKNIKLSNASAAYKFIKPASQMAQDNYPEILGNMFILNAPFLFTGIWAIVKMWIDEKTKQKIQILGSNYKKQLLKYIDPENLPDFIQGGLCKCKQGDCLSLNIGPWNPQGQQLFPQCFKLIKQQKQQQKNTITNQQTQSKVKESQNK